MILRYSLFALIFSISACTTLTDKDKRQGLTKGDLSDTQEALPKVVVSPKYPLDALMNNVEGYVVLLFDVNANGSPENIRVIDSKPEGVFVKSILNVIEQWQFKPKYIDGKAVIQKDMRYTTEFRLE